MALGSEGVQGGAGWLREGSMGDRWQPPPEGVQMSYRGSTPSTLALWGLLSGFQSVSAIGPSLRSLPPSSSERWGCPVLDGVPHIHVSLEPVTLTYVETALQA